MHAVSVVFPLLSHIKVLLKLASSFRNMKNSARELSGLGLFFVENFWMENVRVHGSRVLAKILIITFALFFTDAIKWLVEFFIHYFCKQHFF
jgi:hypothetical protein